MSQVESEPPEDRDDLIPILDEELSRLPDRYRAALVACELEGKSRREAAEQLGIPEGTLSTHLARGRKMLRERLQRRGVTLGVGPIAGLARPSVEAAVPERLIGPTVRAALVDPSGAGATAVVSAAVSSLAERVLKMMFLARLTSDRRGSDDDGGRGGIHRGRARLVHDGGGTPERRSVARRHRGPAGDPVRRGRPAAEPDRGGSTSAPGQTRAAGTGGQGHRHRPRGGSEGPAGLGRHGWSCSPRGGGSARATPGPPGTCRRPGPTPTVASGSSSR